MKKHLVSSSLLIATILVGWLFFSLGRDWFLVYVIFGGAILMAVLALLEGRAREGAPNKSSRAPKCRTLPGAELDR